MEEPSRSINHFLGDELMITEMTRNVFGGKIQKGHVVTTAQDVTQEMEGK